MRRSALFVATVLAWITAALHPAAAAPAAGPVLLEGEVRALVAVGSTLVAAGPDGTDHAFYVLLDSDHVRVRALHRPRCHRCTLLAGTRLDDGRVALVGSRQDAATVPARGWVLVIDPGDGRILRTATLAGRGPVTLRAVDAAGTRILVGGEAEPAMGVDAVGVAALLRAPDLAVEAEWPFEGPTPRTVQAVRILAPGDFLAGGWRLDGHRGLSAGWMARFGFRGEPFWQRDFSADDGPEVVGLPPAAGAPLVVGHAVGFAEGAARFAPLVIRIDRADGRPLARTGPLGEGVRMVTAALPDGDGLLVTAASGPRGGEMAELLRVDGAGRLHSLVSLHIAERPSVPAALVRDADGRLWLGGWLRGEDAPRGWVLRIDQALPRGMR